MENKVESTCDYIRERLSAWLDGELAEAEWADIAAHIDICTRCRRELDQLVALDAALESLRAPAAPEDLAERVLARLKPSRRRPWWQNMALAASLVIGVVLGGALARDFYPTHLDNSNGAEMIAMEDFHDFPQGSLGSILVSYQAEDGNGA